MSSSRLTVWDDPRLGASFWDEGAAQAEARAALAAARAGGVGRFFGQCPAAGGAPRWWDVVITPIVGSDGRLDQLLAVSRDVTDRKRLEEVLKENDSKKDEFLAMLAHELRNPLAAIGNAVQLSRRSTLSEHQEWAKGVVEGQVKNFSRLIDDLLDVSRITRGKIELKKRVVDVRPAIEQAVTAVTPLVEERKHRLSVEYGHGDARVDADATRLEQVVTNLLTNAAKYSEDGGRIRLTTGVEAGELVLTVEDSGLGIPPEKIPEMFELFAQGDRSIERSEGGLGIGLTLARRLLEMHGGTITAESEGTGRGSTFTVRLPTTEAAPEDRVADERERQDGAEKLRVLVVDDNVDTARGLARLLKIGGHDVAVAHDGSSALEMARAFGPDAVVLDIGLPGMDGYDVAARLRSEECCEQACLIAVTGYGQERDRTLAKEAGFDHHLTKPVDFDSLAGLLSRRCRHSGEVQAAAGNA